MPASNSKQKQKQNPKPVCDSGMVINPETGRCIKQYGPTHLALLQRDPYRTFCKAPPRKQKTEKRQLITSPTKVPRDLRTLK